MGKVKGLKKVTALLAVFCLILPVIAFTGCGSNGLKVTLATQDGFLSVKPGESTQLVVTLKNKGKNDDVADVLYSITSGSAYATLEAGGVLAIKADAAVGSKVKVIAKLGNKKSNTLEITVDRIAINTITLSSNKSTILPSAFATLTVATDPVHTTDEVECVITQGADIAYLSGNNIMVKDSAVKGSVIKVKAFSGTVESNELEFTVAEGTLDKFNISMRDEITVDINGITSNVLTAKVKDESFDDLLNQAVEFQIEEGGEFISITPSGYDCAIGVLGHGTAKIRATLDNGNSASTIVNAIRPPEDLDVLEVFGERQSINYTVGNTSALSYEAKIHETNVCKEIEYSFEKKEGSVYVKESTPDQFATYSKVDKTISFNTTGVIRVIAKSNSGSRVEATVSQDFTVNNGVNVSTFAQLKSVLEGTTDPRVVNFVVLEKPEGYGYELVPQQGAGDGDWRTINALGDVTINGNNHRINLSGLDRDVNTFPGMPSLISIKPNGTQAYTVAINDLQVIGSIISPMDESDYFKDLDQTDPKFYFYNRIIAIGNEKNTDYAFNDPLQTSVVAPCYLTMNNIDISRVVVGMRICHAVNAKISNTRVADCWSNGIETASSIIDFENMTYGLCGAAGIEVTPEFSNKAGVNFNQNQSVTFSGYIESTNVSSGSTKYLESVDKGLPGGTTLAGIISGIAASLSDFQESCILNEGQFQFVALVFNDPPAGINHSQFYAGSATNSIAPISQASVTHQYLLIELPMGFGQILIKNWKYQA